MKEFKDICTTLKTAIPGGYAWEWDNRFGTILVCLKEEDCEEVKKHLSRIFKDEYNTASIKKATAQEKNLIKDLSGLKTGQLLFTYNNEENTLFGAWWPWGDGSKISLRIGIYTIKADEEYEQKTATHLKLWFALT